MQTASQRTVSRRQASSIPFCRMAHGCWAHQAVSPNCSKSKGMVTELGSERGFFQIVQPSSDPQPAWLNASTPEILWPTLEYDPRTLPRPQLSRSACEHQWLDLVYPASKEWSDRLSNRPATTPSQEAPGSQPPWMTGIVQHSFRILVGSQLRTLRIGFLVIIPTNNWVLW